MAADIVVKGLEEAQVANLRALAVLAPDGAAGRAVQRGLKTGHRYLTSITHVDTGTLRAGHRVAQAGLEGRIFVDPAARNPRSGAAPADYIMQEEQRGGGHAPYARTADEAGPRIAEDIAAAIWRAL